MHLAELEHISENITSGHGAGKPPALQGSTGSSWGAPTAQQITLGPSDVLSDLRPNAMHYNYKGISNNLFFSLLVLVRVPCSGHALQVQFGICTSDPVMLFWPCQHRLLLHTDFTRQPELGIKT